MRGSFAKGVPIVPSVGNNDVYPHNVMAGGPSKLTDRLAKWARSVSSRLERQGSPCAQGLEAFHTRDRLSRVPARGLL